MAQSLLVGLATEAKQDEIIAALEDFSTNVATEGTLQAILTQLGVLGQQATAANQTLILTELQTLVGKFPTTLDGNAIRVSVQNSEVAVSPKAGETFPVSLADDAARELGRVQLQNSGTPYDARNIRNLSSVTDSVAVTGGVVVNNASLVVTPGDTFPISGAVSIIGQPLHVLVDNPLTVSGTVTTTPTGTQLVDVHRIGGVGFTLGQKTGAGSIPVVLSSDMDLEVTAILRGDPADLNSDVGVDEHDVFAIGLPGPTGHVVGGTVLNPLRVDPTGTTVQPVSGTISIGNLVSVTGNVSLDGQPITVQGGVSVINDGLNPIPVEIVAGALPSDINVAEFGGVAVSLGQQLAAASIPVVLPAGTTLGVTASAPLPVSGTVAFSNTSIGVTATDLDIRNLNSAADSVTVTGIVGITGPVQVQATDLDIRNLSNASDSVAAVQSGMWAVQATQSGPWNVGVTGPVSVTQGGAFSTGRTWQLTPGTDGVTVQGTVTVNGAVTASRDWTLDASTDNVAVSGNVGIAGVAQVDAANPFPVTQSGSWSMDRQWSLAANSDSVTVEGTVLAQQSGVWTTQRDWVLSALTDTVGVSGSVAATQSGLWSVSLADPIDLSDRDGRILGRTKLLSALGDVITPSQEHVQADDSHSVRLTDGAAFYDARNIRALDANTDSVTVTGEVTLATGANFDGTVDLVKVGGVAFSLGQHAPSASIPVVLPAGPQEVNGTVNVGNLPAVQAVSATDLDIRNLAFASDSVTAYQGGAPWAVSGTVGATQVGAWAVSRLWTLASTFDSVRIGNTSDQPIPVYITADGDATGETLYGTQLIAPLASETVVQFTAAEATKVRSVFVSGNTDGWVYLSIAGDVKFAALLNRSDPNVEKAFSNLAVELGQQVVVSVTCTGPESGTYHGTIEHG